VHDVPHAGEEIKRGAPVCTLISAGATVPELVERGAGLMSALALLEAVPVGG
jgi:predicted ATP-grasp superfamily ATP-dependent carboligase